MKYSVKPVSVPEWRADARQGQQRSDGELRRCILRDHDRRGAVGVAARRTDDRHIERCAADAAVEQAQVSDEEAVALLNVGATIA